tara:strand:- start:342 stop:1175 length:834 start_codon:yes stop_codon:yes gene_type:complete
MKKYIYIGGYGRSGSTILDLFISSSGLFSVGEFICIRDNYNSGKPCTCGDIIEECNVWKSLVLRRNKSFFKSWFSSLFKEWDTNSKLNYSIVDSSKTSYNAAWRPFYILYIARNKFKFKYIHVFRSPFTMVKSVFSGSNKLLEKGIDLKRIGLLQSIKTIINYYVSFLAGCLIKLFNKDKTIFLDFEEFLADEELRNRLVSYLDLDKIPKFKNGFKINKKCSEHMIDGNRLRFKDEIVFKIPSTPKFKSLSLIEAFTVISIYPAWKASKIMSNNVLK